MAAERGGGDLAQEYRIAVLVPCYNESATIGKVVAAFAAVLPGAAIHVYDNNSSDDTAAVARAAGAAVGRELRQGKGHVVRRMFAEVEADIYVLVDGDATYDAPSAGKLVARLIDEKLDMVVAARVGQVEAAYRPGHLFGNRMLTGFVARVFGASFTDMLSGYRVFSRRFVKSFPVLSSGFEIDTELTIHALNLVLTYLETGRVPRLPTAVLSTGLMIVAFLSIACGLVLDTVTRGRREMKLLAYLALPSAQKRREGEGT
jgi:glycosyltransferase involved in cell wall biosynthesis